MNTIMDTWNKEDLSIFKELEHLRKNCCHVDFCSSVLEALNYKKVTGLKITSFLMHLHR